MLEKLRLSLTSLAIGLATISMPVGAKQIMTMVDGEEIEVEIVTMGTSEISYKKASNPSGPTYTTSRNKVFFILFEDGNKEIITPLDAQTATTSQPQDNGGSLLNTATRDLVSGITPVPEKEYFNHISFYPRAAVGFHATPSGYNGDRDSWDIDWGGLYWSFDLNVLFPSGRTSAWSAGLGVLGLGGTMNMLYVQGGEHHKDKMGSFDATYLTIPISYWYKGSDWFMFGFGNRFEFLVSQKMEGKKVEDAFRGFRDAITIDAICTIGNLDLGAQIFFNLSSALKGENLDWSPTIGMSFTAGYRF